MGGNRAATLNSKAGSDFERRALEFLTERGLRPVAQNVRCRFGEIDLVMRDGRMLVIVEVRYRRKNAYASATLSVGRAKQQKITRAANWFLGRHPRLADLPLRFDVVAFDWDGRFTGTSDDGCELQWLQDAFRPASTF